MPSPFIDGHWRNLWCLTTNLFNIPATFVHCFVMCACSVEKIIQLFGSQLSRIFWVLIQKISQFSEPWKAFKQKEIIPWCGWFILSPCDRIAQHHLFSSNFPELRRWVTNTLEELSLTNTHSGILCIVYIFYTSATIWYFCYLSPPHDCVCDRRLLGGKFPVMSNSVSVRKIFLFFTSFRDLQSFFSASSKQLRKSFSRRILSQFFLSFQFECCGN